MADIKNDNEKQVIELGSVQDLIDFLNSCPKDVKVNLTIEHGRKTGDNGDGK